MTPWTEERVETLKRLWLEGLSASRIAYELSSGHEFSRNAVIGKVHRLGISRETTATFGEKVSVGLRNKFGLPPVKRQPRKRKPIPAIQRKATVMEMPVPKRVVPASTVPVPLMLSIMELTSTTCRWPIGDPRDGMAYCGCDKDVTDSYCSFHMAIAYVAPVDRAARAAAKLRASLRRAA